MPVLLLLVRQISPVDAFKQVGQILQRDALSGVTNGCDYAVYSSSLFQVLTLKENTDILHMYKLFIYLYYIYE